jgi:hypothetical protein
MTQRSRIFIHGLCGLVYGIGLSFLGAWAAGWGHGSYVLLILASSPFAALGGSVAILTPPFMWGGVWALLQARLRQRGVLVAVISVYYASAALLIAVSPFDENWNNFWSALRLHSLIIAGGFLWYLVGQVFMLLNLRSANNALL